MSAKLSDLRQYSYMYMYNVATKCARVSVVCITITPKCVYGRIILNKIFAMIQYLNAKLNEIPCNNTVVS